MGEMMKPLTDLHDLEEFKISNLISPSSEDISPMTKSWPNLKHLKVDVDPIPPPAHGSTSDNPNPFFAIGCLTDVANHCPKLISLDMTIGISDEHLPDTFPIPATPHNLRSLNLYAPLFRDHAHLARLVCKIFPGLVEIKMNGSCVLGPRN